MRLDIIRSARIKVSAKSESCMVYTWRIIFERTRMYRAFLSSCRIARTVHEINTDARVVISGGFIVVVMHGAFEDNRSWYCKICR